VDNFTVINASPLIFFSRGKQIGLLHHFAQRIFVPLPVAEEIRMKGKDDITAKNLDNVPFLIIAGIVISLKPVACYVFGR